MADPYSTLGVSKGADEKAIKSAYRKLAKELHPDKNQDNPKAAERFSEITQAYDLLSDPQKRGSFDRGEIDENGQPRSPFGGGFGGGGNPFGVAADRARGQSLLAALIWAIFSTGCLEAVAPAHAPAARVRNPAPRPKGPMSPMTILCPSPTRPSWSRNALPFAMARRWSSNFLRASSRVNKSASRDAANPAPAAMATPWLR